MEEYANLNENSEVSSYHIGKDYIWVRFTSGAIYEYTYLSAGVSKIETMKAIARSGSGLGTFIDDYVKNSFSKKLK